MCHLLAECSTLLLTIHGTNKMKFKQRLRTIYAILFCMGAKPDLSQ